MFSQRVIAGITALMVSAAAIAAQTEIPVPRSKPQDTGKYFILEQQRTGDIVRVVHKRVGERSTGYSITEFNCATMQALDYGYSEKSASAIKQNPSNWFDLVPGTSKQDIALFVCKAGESQPEGETKKPPA